MSQKHHHDYKISLSNSGKDIYTPIEVGDADYWIPTVQLEALLNESLQGLSLSGLPLRTRSKVVKSEVCRALGYMAPLSFKRSRPRFFGQQLDVYVQKSLNLQIWNEELSPARRYAIIHVTENDTIGRVRVVNGQELALFDTTGTITTKYQARLVVGVSHLELVSEQDTLPIQQHVCSGITFSQSVSPVDEPESGMLIPVSEIYSRLSTLIGATFADPGRTQERNRGAALHRLICERLGYSRFDDNGQFPDVRHQILEVKLQTSPTIDLGLVSPDSSERLDIQQVGAFHPRHCDTRYAIFYAATDGVTVRLTHLLVVTGEEFFQRFRRFEGKVKNGKIQIRLARDFFAG